MCAIDLVLILQNEANLCPLHAPRVQRMRIDIIPGLSLIENDNSFSVFVQLVQACMIMHKIRIIHKLTLPLSLEYRRSSSLTRP